MDSLPLQGRRSLPPVSSFSCLSNKLFPRCKPDVSVIGIVAHRANELGLGCRRIAVAATGAHVHRWPWSYPEGPHGTNGGCNH